MWVCVCGCVIKQQEEGERQTGEKDNIGVHINR